MPRSGREPIQEGPTLIPVEEARSGLPKRVAPMRPRLAAGPFNSPDHIFEVKWDGVRALAARDRDGLRLSDRHGGDLLKLVPELRDMRIPEGAFLDGEVIVCDRRGRPSYDLLASRLGPRAARRGRGPLFVAFDLLYEEYRPLLSRSCEMRRSRLLAMGLGGRGLVVPEHLEDDGEPFFDAIEEYGLEGIVAKQRRSPYLAGSRGSEWLKCYVSGRTDVVVGGLVVDEARGARTVLCGRATDGGLAYAGEAYVPPFLGHWLDEATRSFSSDASPFSAPIGVRAGLRWLQPRLVAVVESSGTANGQLVDARFRFLRLDGRLDDTRAEEPVAVPSAPASGPAERPRLVVLHSLLPLGPQAKEGDSTGDEA